MRILVTGGLGFTGAALTERLLDDGHQVVALDKQPGLIDEHFEVTDDQSRAFLGGFVDSFVNWIDRYGEPVARAVAAE